MVVLAAISLRDVAAERDADLTRGSYFLSTLITFSDPLQSLLMS